MTFDEIKTKQEAFKAIHGIYFQVLEGGKRPPDRNEALVLTGFPKGMSVNHYHNSTTGDQGFDVVERKIENGKEYQKQTGHGRESKTYDWREIVRRDPVTRDILPVKPI